jgi:hypothetical protein
MTKLALSWAQPNTNGPAISRANTTPYISRSARISVSPTPSRTSPYEFRHIAHPKTFSKYKPQSTSSSLKPQAFSLNSSLVPRRNEKTST